MAVRNILGAGSPGRKRVKQINNVNVMHAVEVLEFLLYRSRGGLGSYEDYFSYTTYRAPQTAAHPKDWDSLKDLERSSSKI